MYQYRAKLESVTDGDTIKIRVDLGFNTWRLETIRLFGVNCPEIRTAEGIMAREFVARWFDQAGNFVLESIKDKQEKYGRYLGIIRPLPGLNGETKKSLNRSLLDAGYAKPFLISEQEVLCL